MEISIAIPGSFTPSTPTIAPQRRTVGKSSTLQTLSSKRMSSKFAIAHTPKRRGALRQSLIRQTTAGFVPFQWRISLTPQSPLPNQLVRHPVLIGGQCTHSQRGIHAVGSAAWASGNSRKANGSSARNGAAAPRGAWAKPPASVRSGAPTPPVAPNVWSSGIPKFNTLGSQYSRSAAVPASGSIAPTRSSASVNESTTVRSGSSVGSNAETIVEFFEDDDDRKHWCMLLPYLSHSVTHLVGSQISSVTDSLAETKLFSSEPKSTHPTTFVEQPNAADSIAENAWATEPDEKDDIRERAKCPAHQKLCNPNVCAIIELHCKSLGINYRDVKLGGPSNVYTIDRGQLYYVEHSRCD